MQSSVTVKLDNIKDEIGSRIKPGDILLIRNIEDGRKLLVRVDKETVGRYNFSTLGTPVIYKIESEELFAGTTVTTTACTKFMILGICDVEITITNLKK